MSELTTLQKLGNAKYYTQVRIDDLIELDSPLKNQYQRAKDCNSIIVVEEGKRKTSYCNSRACNVCNRIRMAKGMNGYMSQIDQKNSFFITLTMPTVDSECLRSAVKYRQREWKNIRRKIQREHGVIDGFTKIECTYNSEKKWYHPHLHIVLSNSNWGIAHKIRNEWFRRNECNIGAQKIKKIKEGTLLELFKYSVKDISKTDKDAYNIPPKIFDNIMIAFKGVRTFQPFGKIRRIQEDLEELEGNFYYPQGVYYFNKADRKFYNKSTGEELSIQATKKPLLS